MRINYLISAFSNERHLAALIDSLRTDAAQVRFIVHYDKKSGAPKSSFGSDVAFISPIKVYWGGWSHQQAIINLSQASVNASADWHVLLSGGDYPIRSNETIVRELSKGDEVITLRKGFSEDKPAERVLYHHFDRFDRRSNVLRTRVFFKLERLLRRVYKRKMPFNDIFHGTTWWALSDPCLRFVLDELKRDSRRTRFYKNAWCAEESLFHTIIGNSPFAAKARPSWTFQDWSVTPAPGPFKPHLVDMAEREENHHFLFGRKFVDSSEDVRKLVDARLRGKRP